MALVLLLGGWSVTTLIVSPVLRMLSRERALRPNYQGCLIPSAGGLAVVLGATIPLITVPLGYQPDRFYYLFIAAVWGMTLAGLADDLLGTREILGFKGHIARLVRGDLTTGGLKAVTGGMIALLAAAASRRHAADIIVDTLLVALSANTINLFDLRPGRAAKAFLALVFLMYLMSRQEMTIYLFALAGAVAAFMPYDLREAAMLGDTGSNPLGIAIGLSAIHVFPIEVRVLILAVLILTHWYLERNSLSAIIEAHPLLRLLDHLGRSS